MSNIEIKGVEQLIAKIENIGDLEGKLTKAALAVEDDARTRAPKRTGALKGLIETKIEKNPNEITATIFSPLEYAPYQEYGTGLFAVNGDGRKTGWAYEDEQTGETVFTRGNKPHPFLGPALRENKDIIMRYFREGLK